MRLLVSVRWRTRWAALAGGADIIDAKEPSSGSLGAVAPEVLAAIAAGPGAGVAEHRAGGSADGGGDRRGIVARLSADRGAPTFLKLGFAGERPADVVTAS